MKLKDKIAVVFGAAGHVGRAVVDEFARQGAALCVSDTNAGRLEALHSGLPPGTTMRTDCVDALSVSQVDSYLDGVAQAKGGIDIVLNLTGATVDEYDNGLPAHLVKDDKFRLPFNTAVVSNFVTSRSAARHMLPKKSGTILFLSASPSKGVAPGTVSIAAAMGALESMMKVFASEWSPQGLRVTGVRSFGMIDTFTIQHTLDVVAHGLGQDAAEFREAAKDWTLQKRFPETADTAQILAFAASEAARTMTGAILNSSCGQVLD